MEVLDFVIPWSLDALQESCSAKQYTVANVSTAREVSQQIYGCLQSFKRDGVLFIVDQNNFDNLYSMVVNFESVEEDIRMKGWELMLKVLSSISTQISNEMDISGKRELWLVAVKMNTYIACMLTEAFDKLSNKPSIDVLLTSKKGKKAKKTECGFDWEEERVRMLVQLFALIQSPIYKLWDPPILEEDYVNLIANCCYKMLQTPNISLGRSKACRDSIFQILGTLVKRYNHELAASLKLIQLVQHFEHAVSVVAEGVVLMVEHFQVKSVLLSMIREIVKIDAEQFSKDSSGLRNYSQFLADVAERSPHLCISSLPLLVPLLEQEAYCMRNCILSMMGCIVKGVLKGETLDNKSRNLRDECLAYLEDYIHDVHAFVRSKVLQIWEELINAQAVPLAQQNSVLKKVVNRLRDKSSNVRKYALHLLSAFLKGNPFAAKLPLEDLHAQFESEKKSLDSMCPGISLDDQEPQHHDDSDVQEKWVALVPSINNVLRKMHPECSSDEESDEDMEDIEVESILGENASLNSGVELVGEYLVQGNVRKAVVVLKEVQEKFANATVLQLDEEDDAYSAIKACQGYNDLTTTQKPIFLLLHRIFISFVRMKAMLTNEEEKEKAEDSVRNSESVQKQKIFCCYLRDCICFAEELHRALPDICQLLGSKQVSDALEAIKFFIAAFEFGLQDAMVGVRKMLVLVWSKEPAIKEAVVDAYRKLYINVDVPSERSRALHIVRNLSALTSGATFGELTSMEEIVSQFIGSGDMNKHCTTLLWERFTRVLPETTDQEARLALTLLTMAAKSETSIVSTNLDVLIEAGLKRPNNDFAMIKTVCQALSKMAVTSPKTDDALPPNRLEQNHEMFVLLGDILVNRITQFDDTQYTPMAIEAITTIYLLAEHPDAICGDIIKRISKHMLSFSRSSEDEGASHLLHIPIPIMSRFIAICGHVASRQLVHLDTFILCELKRRNQYKEEQLEKKKSKKKQGKSRVSSSAVKEASDKDIDEEMGVSGAVADDLEVDFIRSVCEKEIVTGEALLSLIKTFVIGVCANPTKYSDPMIKASASSALSKFMLVSSECCEENLQLLFTILEKSQEPVIRANTVIALRDLTIRFPNVVEPWTPKIYARLRDESTLVKHNTLTVLSQLILNDQVKVKGQISDIAVCMTDDDRRLAALSKLFFNELSKKGNALYNVLPDIISRLSDTEIGIGEAPFKSIVSHIFGLVQKDRQLEAFVEKLCYRLQGSNEPRQWRDITYCLSLLPYTEKSIRKLTENFSSYADKLHEPDVYELFVGILASARKTVRPEAKAAIEELESRVVDAHEKGVENEKVVSKAIGTKSKLKIKASGKKKKKVVTSESDEDEC